MYGQAVQVYGTFQEVDGKLATHTDQFIATIKPEDHDYREGIALWREGWGVQNRVGGLF